MNVTTDEGRLFYDLYAALLSFVNRKLKVSSEQFSDARGYTSTSPDARVAIRDALFTHRELIDEFVQENPAGFSADDLQIVGNWRRALVGKFYAFRYQAKYTVFLTSGGSPNRAYGVLGLTDPLERVIGSCLPRLIQTALLPFRDKIIYDGLISNYNITFGGVIKKTLNDEYKRAKEAFGIITSLEDRPVHAEEPPRTSKQRPRKATAEVGVHSASSAAKAIADELVKVTDAFCREFLNEEYAELCRKLASALARKRPSPLLRGSLGVWAAGVVRTIGWANFLHDPSQTPHLKLYAIDEAFGIAESTGAAKLKEIRTMFRIHQLDPKWTLPSRLDDNPMVWMMSVNGFLMDIRDAPREVQVQAFKKGLIPYIPADRSSHSDEDE